MLEVENEGWGRVMHWRDLEENAFRKLVLEVLNSTKMTEIAKQRSVLMKDRLVPPDEEAAYWIEYVLRHNGAPHLRSPLFMMKW
ncbi:hypothetical protein Anas_01644 [Armadillidium nasatum]|uniref:Uncharacterized protein n=1 Tax=Armadillidium nasatum TaxID=96803 RepID=A0A5N5TGE1_9CRUS|nr:hypothetical protein Anas_01644 [Armadillidium nasatum]